MNVIEPESVVVASADQVSSDLAGGVVILNLRDSVYYGLNSVGSRIWQLLKTPQKVSVICDVIAGEYAVDPQSCMQDTITLLEQLAQRRLVEVNVDAVA